MILVLVLISVGKCTEQRDLPSWCKSRNLTEVSPLFGRNGCYAACPIIAPHVIELWRCCVARCPIIALSGNALSRFVPRVTVELWRCCVARCHIIALSCHALSRFVPRVIELWRCCVARYRVFVSHVVPFCPAVVSRVVRSAMYIKKLRFFFKLSTHLYRKATNPTR